MLCQECRNNEAHIQIIKIVDGKKTELYLCEQCARMHEDIGFSAEPQFELSKLFGSMLNQGLFGNRDQLIASRLQCPACGLSFAQFSQVGKLGCTECLATFEDKLKPLLKRIHASCSHTGKVPVSLQGKVQIIRELDQLKEDLQNSIYNEEFEEAAKLRDRIRHIEKQMQDQ